MWESVFDHDHEFWRLQLDPVQHKAFNIMDHTDRSI